MKILTRAELNEIEIKLYRNENKHLLFSQYAPALLAQAYLVSKLVEELKRIANTEEENQNMTYDETMDFILDYIRKVFNRGFAEGREQGIKIGKELRSTEGVESEKRHYGDGFKAGAEWERGENEKIVLAWNLPIEEYGSCCVDLTHEIAEAVRKRNE